MINFLKWLPALATALAMLLAQRSLMHDFQLESYQFPGYFRTLRRNWKRALLPGVTLAAYLTLLYLAYRSVDRMLDMSVGKILLALVNAALAVAGGWWCRSIFQQKKAKKPFVVTMRVKRTYIVMGVVYTLLCTPIALLTKVYFCGLLPLLLPLWVALGGLLAWPIEKLVSEMYFRDGAEEAGGAPGHHQNRHYRQLRQDERQVHSRHNFAGEVSDADYAEQLQYADGRDENHP